jgi:hypothetical protein
MTEERAAEPVPAAAANRYSQRATSEATLYAEVETAHAVRLTTGIGEFDRVLGGGIVPGSLVLLGGEPELASRRCSCRRRRTCARESARPYTRRAKSPSIRSRAVAIVSASVPHRSISCRDVHRAHS